MQRHRQSLSASCLRVNAVSHIYLGTFYDALQDFEDEMWLHLEMERESREFIIGNSMNDDDAAVNTNLIENSAERTPSPVSSSGFFSQDFEGEKPRTRLCVQTDYIC
mgnify:CR=1 FL=1